MFENQSDDYRIVNVKKSINMTINFVYRCIGYNFTL